MPKLDEMKKKVEYVDVMLEKNTAIGYSNNLKKQIIEFSRIKFNDETNKERTTASCKDLVYLKSMAKEYVEDIH